MVNMQDYLGRRTPAVLAGEHITLENIETGFFGQGFAFRPRRLATHKNIL